MSSVPQPTFGPRGAILPDGQAVLDGVKADINTAFGGNLNMADETPQGQLAVTLSAMTEFRNDLFLWFCNQVDPAYSSGRMQDAIARIYFLDRRPSTATVVLARVTGLAGKVIPAGSVALATDDNTYSSLDAVTIPASGFAYVQFQCNRPGPIPCPAGTLNRIYRASNGWDSINNEVDGTLGADTESRADFEKRRQESTSKNSRSMLSSIRGAVLGVEGVLDVYVNENDTGTAKTIGAVTLQPNSLYVAVTGGADNDIAFAIWSKKSGGCGYTGNTTVMVEDTSPGYSPPYPQYEVKFYRPTSVPIHFSVDIADGADVPSTADSQIKDAIISVFNGVGGERERIGSPVYASRYYCAVAALGPWVRIKSIQVGQVTGNMDVVPLEIDESPTISASNIVVTAS